MTILEDTVLAAGVAGLCALYRSGASDPVAVTTLYLDRIARDNPALGAMVAVDRAGAMAAAAQSRARWRSGRPLSILDGVPIAIKANIAVAGLPWTAGIAAYGDRVAAHDAACVAGLRDAGVVVLGLTNMDEGALGARGDNAFLGRCHNPHAPGFTPGGSSGGSAAAVAAGFCAAALGTDTIGSVRMPAACCGVFGHKPRQALIDRQGVVPLSPRFDHVGVLARSAQDCAAILGLMLNSPLPFRGGVGGGGHRDGSAPDRWEIGARPHPNPSPEGEGPDRCRATTADAGAIRLGMLDLAGYPGVAPDIAASIADVAGNATPVRLAFDFARISRLMLIVAEVEGAAVHAAMLHEWPEGFSPGFARLLHWGQGEGQSRYAAALDEIAAAAQAAEADLARFDALVLPATGQPAFAHDGPAPVDQADFMTLASVMGWPATAFPIGTSLGLPIAAQVLARDDATCLMLAGALSRPVARHPPPAARR